MDKATETALLRAWCGYRGMEFVDGHVNPRPSDNFVKGFLSGKAHILSLPLAERLTEEERKKIKNIYHECELIEMDD